LEAALNNEASEKHAVENQMDEWKELLKVKEEEIAILKEQMEDSKSPDS